MAQDPSSIIGRKQVDYGFSDSASRLTAATGDMAAHDATGGAVGSASRGGAFTARAEAGESAVARIRKSSDAPDSADAFVSTGSDDALPSAVENAFPEDGGPDEEAEAEAEDEEAVSAFRRALHVAGRVGSGGIKAGGAALNAADRLLGQGAGGGGASPFEARRYATAAWEKGSLAGDADARLVKVKKDKRARHRAKAAEFVGLGETAQGRTVADTGEGVESSAQDLNDRMLRYTPANPYAAAEWRYTASRGLDRARAVKRAASRAGAAARRVAAAASDFLRSLVPAMGGATPLLGVLVVVLLLVAVAAALSKNDSTALPPNAREVYEYFSERGVDDLHIAAILGNLQQESSGSSPMGGNDIDPTAGEERPRGATGIAQWTDTRLDALKALAKKSGDAFNTIGPQKKFLWKEYAHETSSGWELRSEFEKIGDIEEATHFFQKHFERAGEGDWAATGSKRTTFAKEYLELIQSSSDSDAVPHYCQADSRWGSKVIPGGFGHTLARAGCGYSSLAMLISAKTGAEVTPWDVAEYGGSRWDTSSGIGWNAFTDAASHWGLGRVTQVAGKTPDLPSSVRKALEAGKGVIVSVNKTYTSGGHIMLLYGLEDGRIMCHNSSFRTCSADKWGERYSTTEMADAAQRYWIYEDCVLDGGGGSLSAAKRDAIVAAAKGMGSFGSGHCSEWVGKVYAAAGLKFYQGSNWGNGNTILGNRGNGANHHSGCIDLKTQKSKIKKGMILSAQNSGPGGLGGGVYGHTAIYIGDGKVMDQISYVRTMGLDEWIAAYGKHGWVVAGYPQGI